MPFDGLTLQSALAEAKAALLGKRAQRIYQPLQTEIHVHFGGKPFLLLSCSSETARASLGQKSPEYPQNAPAFSMALRKHILGGTLIEAEQLSFDRVARFRFETLSASLGIGRYDLYCEIMGKHSNIVLANAESGLVVDAAKRVSARMSTVREVLPGARYIAPPQQKLSPLDFDEREALDRLSLFSPIPEEKALADAFMGVSRQLARTVCQSGGEWKEALSRLLDICSSSERGGYLYFDGALARDFSAYPYEAAPLRREPMASTCEAVEEYHRSKADRAQAAPRHAQEAKRLKSLLAKAEGKLARRKQEAEAAEAGDAYQQMGNLLLSSPTSSHKGEKKAAVANIYSPEMEPVEIELIESLSLAENAKRYFKMYRKAKNASSVLTGLIEEAENECFWLSSALYHLTTASDEAGAQAILGEAAEKGYFRRSKQKKPPAKAKEEGPIRYEGSYGHMILVGRNDRQNDRLTLREAAKDDIWLHTKAIAGSHVILRCEGREPSEEAVAEAAAIAAWHSSARSSSNVPVDYTKARYVKKPSGAPAGKVIYANQKTLYVDPVPPKSPKA
ncbi:MAG: NFACT family protein [Eubacteriaceae bacterium]|jgi:predicted ribosome quality control (RQC) complex YloA/Tae2 family protein|nr:NFACT family protein [Eubacteriaceae bacterium]